MLFRNFKERVKPVEGGLEIKIIPQTVAEDEGVGTIRLLGWEEGTQAVELVGGDGKPDHHLN